MVWISIIVVVVFIFYLFFRDREKMLESQVDNFGGMQNKYALLLEYLISRDSKAKITKVTRDHIQISYIYPSTSSYFFISENFNSVEVEWGAKYGIVGNHKLSWKFSSNTSQEMMIEKISTDLTEYEEKLFV